MLGTYLSINSREGLIMKYTCHYCGEEYKEPSYSKEVGREYRYKIDPVGLCKECRDKVFEKNEEFRNMTKEEIYKYFNSKFKSVETYEELKEFLLYFNRCGDIPHMEIKSKRSTKMAYAFERNGINPERVDYLYNDSVSTGSSRVENLSRYLEIEIWYY